LGFFTNQNEKITVNGLLKINITTWLDENLKNQIGQSN